jgi:hypothetical protein
MTMSDAHRRGAAAFRLVLTILLSMAALSVSLSGAQAQAVTVQVSKYWCDKFKGSYSGNTCTASYVPHPGACDAFRQLNVDDPQMLAALNEVRNARVCLATRVREAMSATLKLRASLMGFVTAGHDDLEWRADPINNKSYRPEQGKASYWTGVSYYLYQCVVETCTSK